ncbi:MAG: hypothetical protein KDC44_17100, partial [Phaeodactylibacter sp.]|nr:hypothetical protein [Phaeodactylibacter sp.]
KPGTAGGTGGPGSGEDSDLQKMMDQLEAQRKADQEALDKILEGLNQEDTTETIGIGSVSGGPMYLPMEGAGVNTLLPALDLKGSDGPCECQPLNVTFGEPHFWVYWIGVGEEAMERYNEREKRFQRKLGQIVSLAQLYGKRIFELGTLSAKLPPIEAYFPTDLDEQSIEYAIVEEAYKDAFLHGEPFLPIASGLVQKNVAFDYGNAPVEMGKAYWLCTRNHYPYSSVSYAFVYETFSVNNQIEQ